MLVQGKDFPEVATPSVSPQPLVVASKSRISLCPEPTSFPKPLPEVAACVIILSLQTSQAPCLAQAL